MTTPEKCDTCGTEMLREFVPSKVYFNGTKVTHAEWNPGLGAVVRNKSHREDLAKRKGLVEIGNDFKSGEKLQEKFETDKADKLKKAWDDV